MDWKPRFCAYPLYEPQKNWERLNDLKVTPGPFLTAVVDRLSCVIEAQIKRGQVCQPYFFDSAARVEDTVRLFLNDPIESVDHKASFFAEQNSRISWPSIKSYRNKYIDGLVKSLQKYYAEENMEDFEILNPKAVNMDLHRKQLIFPQNSNGHPQNLVRRLKINSPNLGVQLKNFYENVAVEISYETFKEWTDLPAGIYFTKF